MKRARYHPAARDELRAAVAYNEAERPGRGIRLEAAVRRVLRRIQLLPRSAPRNPHVEGSPKVRHARVKQHPYVVVYEEAAEYLVVLAIAHTSKRPGYWMERVAK